MTRPGLPPSGGRSADEPDEEPTRKAARPLDDKPGAQTQPPRTATAPMPAAQPRSKTGPLRASQPAGPTPTAKNPAGPLPTAKSPTGPLPSARGTAAARGGATQPPQPSPVPSRSPTATQPPQPSPVPSRSPTAAQPPQPSPVPSRSPAAPQSPARHASAPSLPAVGAMPRPSALPAVVPRPLALPATPVLPQPAPTSRDQELAVDLDDETSADAGSAITAQVRTTDPSREDRVLIARLLAGARIGRFTVVRHLDQGGMGLIFAARDEQLDRQVALKILRARSEHAVGRARLLREAQALAKLAHPNVVTVYEVGEFEGHVFIAMEMVEGQTLREWTKHKRRSWREIVAMYVQAGRGLAAAHDAGIVHRDFKPSNVVVGADGRARVLDFGIARTPARDEDHHGVGLTLAGLVAGTPAYMSPEQLQSADVDARADQYSFCMALAEALSGTRPVKGKTVDERLLELAERPVPELPRDARIPAFLRAAVLRGLDPDPDRRYPAMPALLAAIDRDPMRTRLLIAAGVALGAILLIAGFALAQRRLGAACDDAGELTDVWDDSRRDVLGRAFNATGLAYSAVAWERFAADVDAYTTSWRDSRRTACVAHQRGEHSADLYGLQLACLQRRRSALKALVDTLVFVDAKTVDRAVTAAGDLPGIAACNDVAALTAAVAPPDDPAVAAEVAQLRDQLDPAKALVSLRKIDEGLGVAAPILARARELGYAPFTAEAAGVVGSLQIHGTDFEAAEQTLTDAVWLADQVRDDELLADNMASLIFVIGESRGRADDALRWRRHADTVRARLPAEHRGQSRLLHALASVLRRKYNYAESFELEQQALKIAEAVWGPDDHRIRDIIMGLGNAALGKGDLPAARGYYERAVAIQEASFGPDHPALALLLSNLGIVAAEAGDFELSLQHMRRGLAIEEAAYGPEHPDVALSLGNIGAILSRKGDHAAARPIFERSLAIDEKLHRDGHPTIAMTLTNLYVADEALGDTASARVHAERGLAVAEKVFPADDPHLASALGAVGSCDLRDGKAKAALPRLERSLAIREARADVIAPLELAGSRFHVAKALRALGRDPARQTDLATKALTAARSDAAAKPEQIAEIEAFLAAEATPAPVATKGKKKKAKKKAKKKPKKKKKKK